MATVSPLWLHHADRVVLLDGGRVVADGTHEELLATSAAYRRVVARALDDATGAADRPEPGRRPVPGASRPGSSGRRRTAVPDLLATSADTWRDRALDPPAVPPELIPDTDAPWPERLRALRRRHLLREQRAADVYAQSRNPDRGWPVADNAAVGEFFRRLLRERRGAFAAMVAAQRAGGGQRAAGARACWAS